ncbi:DapH/DapD/GlmU-related protein [Litoreibacter janthinus]|uniref:UDP-3-O-[3-hydroxymyristoyl] glucosamine N-acyltransferase n=1 Tax=Litoreibacter janthinus TaxID=670154 RepID=A0A1I6IE54_9RHOB|nr:DapH/DapD/GlmU-related protein [Litoreibacter janthinus]SFR64630.1 UDP-3-O-[3-hydroxymyristoyl] glucosamine N-acyltransferase [Litoreibacter janthinus]
MTKVDAKAVLKLLSDEFSATIVGPDSDFSLEKPVSLDRFAAGTVTFFTGREIAETCLATPTSVLVCHEAAQIPDGIEVKTVVARVSNPRLAFGKLVSKFFLPPADSGVHPSAVVHASSTIGAGVTLGPNSVIGPNCSIGDGTVIGPNVVLDNNVVIGKNCIIRAGSALGQPGFGIEIDTDGSNFQLPHIGGVVLEDDVTIGCLTTVAGGTLNPTYISKGVVIDDHVFLAHNVQVGARSLIIACAEVSGSVKIGEDCWIGPNSSIMNQAVIGNRSLVGLGAVVTKSCPENVVLIGSPARVLKARYPE